MCVVCAVGWSLSSQPPLSFPPSRSLRKLSKAATLPGTSRRNSNIVYLGTWATFKTSGASAGSYKYADSPATALISFNGTRLDLIATKGFTMGKARVSVDGGNPVLVDLYSSTTLRQQKVWSTGPLSQGTHQVTVSWTGQASVSGGGTRVNIDAVDVVGTLAQAALTTIEQDDSRLAYSGTWAASSSSSASGGSVYTGASGSSALVAFNGTDVRYVAKTAPEFGRVKLTLDGGSPVYADLYSSSVKYRRIVWSAFGLEPGNHVLRVEWTGQKNSRAKGAAVNLDALLVAESLAPASATAVTPAPTTTTTTAAPETTTTTVASTTTTVSTTATTAPPPRPPAADHHDHDPGYHHDHRSFDNRHKTIEAKAYCRGDGVTDDTANIARALAACNPGDTLHFAAGTYLGDMVGKEGVFIKGDGDGRGGVTSWIKGQVDTRPHMTFTDLKMGIEGHSWGNTATHGMTVTRCTFTGGPASGSACGVIAYAVDLHDCSFIDSTIEGNASNIYRNGVCLITFGQATGQLYNVEFRNCHFLSQGRIGIEILGRLNSNPYDYPFYNVNLIGCTFEAMGASAISYGASALGAGAGEGIGHDGYSTISGCLVKDAGLQGSGTLGTHGIELAGVVHMTVTGTRSRAPMSRPCFR